MKPFLTFSPILKKTLLLGFLPIFFGFAWGQWMQKKASYNYIKAWQTIDSLKQKGLYQQAFSSIDIILKQADIDKNEPQFAKAILYKTNLLNFYAEDPAAEALQLLNENLKTNIEVRKGLLYSFRADYFKQYYLNNRYRFNNNENIVLHSDDIKDWSENDLRKAILNDYLKSLSYKNQYDNYTLFDFEPALQPNRDGRIYKPTVNDLMVWRVLEYTKNIPGNVEKADYENWSLSLNNNETLDSGNTWQISNFLFKQLIAIHNLRPEAKVYNQLQYLDFIYANSVNDLKDSLYEHSINKLINENAKLPTLVMVANDYAEYLINTAAKFDTDKKINRWNLVKAKSLLEKVIALFPAETSINHSKNLLNQIIKPNLYLNIENYVISERSILVKANVKNINQLHYKIINISKTEFESLKQEYNNEKLKSLLLDKKPVVLSEIKFNPAQDYREHSFEFELNGLNKGFYAIVSSNTGHFKIKEDIVSYNFINVSDITYLVQNKPNQNFDIIVRSRVDGALLKNAKVSLYFQKYDYKLRKNIETLSKSIVTNENGIASYNNSNQDQTSKVLIEYNKDMLISNDYFYSYNYDDEYEQHILSNIYTDRLIYRPGQTVYFKGILHKTTKQEQQTIPNQKVNVNLTDVNGQQVGTLPLTTNEFGSYSGHFILPTNCLTGYFTIEDGYGSMGINVEEYKRPKFETYFNKTKATYKLNQNASVFGTAKSFAGAPIANAKVKYVIYKSAVRYFSRRCFDNYYQAEKVFESGEVLTNDTGGYVINFIPLPDKRKSFYGNYQFRIESNVTDISGESHFASKTLVIGDLEYSFNFQASDAVHTNPYGLLEINDTSRFKISLSNNEGEEIERSVKLSIDKLKSIEKPLYKRLWSMPDTQIQNPETSFPHLLFGEDENTGSWKKEITLGTNSVLSNKYIPLKKLVNKALAEGVYKINAEVTNSNGVKEESEYYFVVKEPSKQASNLNWFVAGLDKAMYQPEDILKLKVYTHLNQSNVFYSIEQNLNESNKHEVVTGYINTSNNSGILEIPVEMKHRGGFFINLSYQENNRTYTQRFNVYVPFKEKDLTITTQSIRDHLLPGAKENWTINISGAKKEKLISEFLCTMYDASLDEIAANYWSSYFYNMSGPIYYLEEGAPVSNAYAQYLSQINYKYYPFSAPQFDYFLFHNSYNSYNRYRGERYDELEAGIAFSATMVADAEAPAESEKMYNKKKDKFDGDEKMEEKSGSVNYNVAGEVATGNASVAMNTKNALANDAPQMYGNNHTVVPRTNFNETAFFYPQLKTNANGDVSISFTMPESLTRWKFMGMAHTTDLKSGILEKFITTSKPIMCTPNLPRTFRQGDEIYVKAKIDNTCDRLQTVKCKLNIEDELLEKNANYLIADDIEKLQTVKPHSSVSVTWKLIIKEAPDLLKITTTAAGDDYTDGEVSYVPVLSNKQLIIESMSFVLDSTSAQFKFESFANNQSDSRIDKHLSVEFTTNPIWTAIQSLPYLMEYPHECSEQLFSRFFANKLAHHVVSKHPEIERVFNIWKISSPDALVSNLNKNPELKQVILNETPWVLEAKDESQQRANLALLFDINKMSNEQTVTLKKLLDTQSPNGGWPWFKGMPDNEYITQYIVEGFYNLEKLNALTLIDNNELQRAVNNGVTYLNNRQKENYQRLVNYKINLKEYVPGRDELINLLIFSRSANYKNYLKKDFNQYFLNQAKSHWLKLSLDNKVILAKILFTLQDPKAKELCNSFKDNAIKNPTIGWYWKENIRSGYYINSGIELHAEMLELFSIYQPDKQFIKQLSKWLILNKRTNKWENTKSTVKAIYALLLDNPVINTSVKSTILLGNKKIDISDLNSEPGTGYFKQNIDLKEMKSEMANIKINTSTKGITYGAVYWKYMDNIDKIDNSGKSLTVSKLYFVKKTNKDRVDYIQVTQDNIKIGDEIMVKLNICSDRDLEYVHLKDYRPSGLEPQDAISGTQYNKGMYYYQSTRDAVTDFFINSLAKGTHEITYKLKANNMGEFSSGVSSIQCMYASEFVGTAKSSKIKVTD